MLDDVNETLSRVGPGTAMGALFRRFWLPALMPSELPGPDCDPVRLRLLGEDLVAFRDTEGRIGVLAEKCPHRRASLFFGRNENSGIRCVYHGWKFDVNGKCLDVPNAPDEYDLKDRIRQPSYPAREWGGFIWVYMGAQDHMPDLPELDWVHTPGPQRWQTKWVADSNYLQAMEGEIDTSHTSFLHREDNPANLSKAVVAAQAMWRKDTAPRLFFQETDYGFYYGSRRDMGDGNYYWRITQWLLPSFAIIPSERWPMISRGYVPIDDEHTFVFATSYNPSAPLDAHDIEVLESGRGSAPTLIPGTYLPALNRSNDYGLDRERQRRGSFTGILGVNDQDRAVYESMGRIADRENEHLCYSDLAVVSARRLLIERARAAHRGGPVREPRSSLDYRVRPLNIVTPIDDIQEVVRVHHDRMHPSDSMDEGVRVPAE